MTFEIITWGNGETLAGILRAVSFMMRGTDSGEGYTGALAVVGMLGFLAALVAYVFAPQKLYGWYWIGSVVMIMSLVILPRADVQVIDRVPGVGPAVAPVPDVPLGLAAVASISSQVGAGITEMFEQAFGAVDDNSYSRAGMMFGNKLIKETSKVTFPSPEFQFDLMQYIQNCIVPDIAGGQLRADVLRTHTDLWDLLIEGGGGADYPGPNPARFSATSVQDTPIMSCTALQTSLQGRGEAQTLAVLKQLGRRLNADAADAGGTEDFASSEAIEGQVTRAYEILGETSRGASGLIQQNAMINAMAAANNAISQRINDPSAIMLGQSVAQARIAQNASWITSAKIAEEAMPLIRNGIECILYAAFPLVVLVLMLTSGQATAKMAKSYAGALMWIQLWPPLYAVLNFMATAASARHIAHGGALPEGGSGLTMLTAAPIYENTVSDLAVVGYLVISIPVIAWSLLKGMDSIGAGALAGAAAFSGGSMAGASAAASGNVSLGNASFDQTNMAPSMKRGFETTETAAGTQVTDTTGAGLHSFQMRQSNLGIDAGTVRAEAVKTTQAAAQAYEAGVSDRKALNQSLSSTFSDMSSFGRTDSRGRTSETGTNASEDTRGGIRTRNSVKTSNSTGEQDQSGNTATNTESVNNSNYVGNTAGGQLQIGVPGIGSLGGGVERGNREEGSNAKQEVLSTADILSETESLSREKDAAKVMDKLDIFVNSEAFKAAHASGNEAAMRLMAGYEEAKQYQVSSEEHFSDSRRLQQQAEYMNSNSNNIATSYNNAAYMALREGGQVGSHVSDMWNDPSSASERLSSVVQGMMANNLGPSVPVSDRLGQLDAGEVDRLRGSLPGQTPDGIRSDFEGNRADVVGRAAAAGVNAANPGAHHRPVAAEGIGNAQGFFDNTESAVNQGQAAHLSRIQDDKGDVARITNDELAPDPLTLGARGLGTEGTRLSAATAPDPEATATHQSAGQAAVERALFPDGKPPDGPIVLPPPPPPPSVASR